MSERSRPCPNFVGYLTDPLLLHECTEQMPFGCDERLGALHTMPPKRRGRGPNSSHSWARGEGRSPLKNIMSVLLSDFEYFIQKSVWLFSKSLGFSSWCAQTLAESPNSKYQKNQKMLLCRYFGSFSLLDFVH